MTEERKTKKLSIDLINLPKLRHKSTHQQKTHQPRSPLLTTHQRKTTSYLIHQPKHSKSISKLDQNLSHHRSQFRQLSNHNHSLLNLTFFKLNQTKKTFEQKKKLQKRKVFTMEKQQFLSRHQQKTTNGDSINLADLNLSKEKDQLYTGPMIVLDYKIQMSWLNHCCYDGIFSLARTGATLAFKDDTLYMFGGYADTPQTNLLLHKFHPNSNQWHHINSYGQKPMLSLMYHTCNTYKDYLIFIGGVFLHKTQHKKFSNSHINIFNITNKNWTQFNWGYYLKHHVSCMIGNIAIVHGGINQRERTQNTMHIVHLNLINLHFSKVFSFSTTQALSHHRMITTVNQDSRLRTKFKVDGIVVFGGKRNNQKLSNQLYYLDASTMRLNDDDTTQTKKWKLVDIKGSKPQPRMCHTFDLLINKGLCVLIGGINENNQYLNDLWIFDLFGLSWTRVDEVPLLQQTGGIAYHCSVVNESQIYVYGGITKNQTQKQFYLIETQKFKRQYSKHQSRKKIDISSNMISFKAFE